MVLAFCWLLGTGLAYAAGTETPTFPLAVVVVDPDRVELPGVSVEVAREGSAVVVVQGTTDARGRWQASLAPGRYAARVRLTGFKPRATTLEVVAASEAPSAAALARFKLAVDDHREEIVLDCGHAYDPLREPGTWRITAQELRRLPGQ